MQFYLTLLDTYLPDHAERAEAFRAVETIPSIRAKAEFCFKWIDSIGELDELRTREDRQHVPAQPDLLRRLHRGAVLLRRLRLRLLPALEGPAQRPGRRHQLGVPRRERRTWTSPSPWSTPCAAEEPDLFDDELSRQIVEMIDEAVEAEMVFVAGHAVRGRARHVGRRHPRVPRVRRRPAPRAPRPAASASARKNPFGFMELQDVQELSNFFERTVSAYQVGVTGDVDFDEDF